MNKFHESQVNLIKKIEKEPRLFWGNSKGFYFYTFDSHTGFLIPEKFFLLSRDALKRYQDECNVDHFVSLFDKTTPAQLSLNALYKNNRTLYSMNYGERSLYFTEEIIRPFLGKSYFNFAFPAGNKYACVVFYRSTPYAIIMSYNI